MVSFMIRQIHSQGLGRLDTLVERSGLCEDEVTETRYFGCPPRDLVAIPTELFRPPITDCDKTVTYSPVVDLHVTHNSPTSSYMYLTLSLGLPHIWDM
jgi:hypothetical protein